MLTSGLSKWVLSFLLNVKSNIQNLLWMSLFLTAYLAYPQLFHPTYHDNNTKTDVYLNLPTLATLRRPSYLTLSSNATLTYSIMWWFAPFRLNRTPLTASMFWKSFVSSWVENLLISLVISSNTYPMLTLWATLALFHMLIYSPWSSNTLVFS